MAKLLPLLLVLGAVALGVWLAVSMPSSPSASSGGVLSYFKSAEQLRYEAYAARSDADFATYRDFQRAYSFRYPLGYSVQTRPQPDVDVLMVAGSQNAYEGIQAAVRTDETPSASWFAQEVQAFQDAGVEVTSSQTVAVNGRTAYRVTTSDVDPFTGIPTVTKTAMYDCPGYLLSVAVIYPQHLAGADDLMSEHVLATVRCQ